MTAQNDSDRPIGPAHRDLSGREPPLTLADRVRSLRLPESPSRGSKKRNWLPWLLCFFLATCTAVLAFEFLNRPETNQPQSPAKKSDVDSTGTTTAAVASSGEIALSVNGYIIPAHQIQVSPKIGGMVMELYFEEGKHVKEGDVLAELEKVDYLADRDHAKYALSAAQQRFLELEHGSRPEEIEAAKAELAESEAQREQLFLDWKRSSSLKPGVVLAARDYEQAYSAYKSMDRRVDRLRQAYKLMVEGPREERKAAGRAEARQAQADLEKAEWRLTNCTVRAPVSGTILTKKAEKGNIVNPIAFNVSASLCDMADLSDLEVDLSVQERDISKVYKGQHCRVRPLAYGERVYDGVVSRTMPIADRAKGAVPVRVKIQVPSGEEGVYLKPEMSAVVSFLKK